ncbi:MAG: glycosyltransferase [Akkermansiaceae bacterium]|nr:glycosyltransferase [Akkermansiaceae bacterium]
MKPPAVSIVMRSFNEAWALRETLPALTGQDFKDWELIVIDSGSSDGSQELIRAANPTHFIQIQPSEYNPSRVMNQGMRLALAETVVFLNADATPQGPHWLRPLFDALQDPQTAAAFSRQIPRPDCEAVFAHDYDRCFGPQRESAEWDHFFSMVSSGLRRDVWAQRGFREDLQYAEDDEYTRWCVGHGYRIHYVAESVAMHSHNYSAPQARKRAFGDARAMAATYPGCAGDFSWPRSVALGWAADLRKDLRWCLRHGRTSEMLHAARIRWAQRTGRLAGFRQGWQDYHREDPS